ncbi:FPP/GGPP synthase family protein [Aspergillus affinis]|uniref:FPP/GGPP synthase family protein n=1 Tax=Aspergillus affinis TaxID=1070780 RepID=UPI0022FF426C|nr:uncharacterized protein KD926_004282 [Aspergillus affinis]KAI9035198.1 hypothetical protein KD926_004282 [Aspergillus affinis]
MAVSEGFQAMLPQVITDLEEDLTSRKTPKEHIDRILHCLHTNVQGGKLNRGLMVVHTARCLVQRPLSDEEFQQLSILGWLTEMFQAVYLIWDDIMDSSQYRRGQPCWYRQEGVGLMAINDAALIRSSIYIILRKNLRNHPDYGEILELFREAAFRTELGQLCDMNVSSADNLARMTPEAYYFIAENKTAFYSFFLPVALALRYVGQATGENLTITQDILFEVGKYFQIQDDYLDVYGDPAVTGKTGTDIQDNKCSWMIIQAMEHGDPEQKALLSLSYGKEGSGEERRIKDLFQDIGMEEIFRDFEEAKIETLRRRISETARLWGTTHGGRDDLGGNRAIDLFGPLILEDHSTETNAKSGTETARLDGEDGRRER